MELKVFAPDSVVLTRPPSPVRTLRSRYAIVAGAGLHNGLDMVSGMGLTLPHGRAMICSAGATTAKAQRLIARSGITITADLRTFRSGDEAVQLARTAVRRGEVLEYQFPPYEPGLLAGPARVPVPLLRELNSKACLDDLIAPEFLPRRQIGSPAQVRRMVADDHRPAVLKPIGHELNSGIAIFTRRLAEQLQRGLFADLEQLSERWVLEEEIDFATVWGVQFAVPADGSVHYLGSSVHLPQPTASWVGCVLDDEQPPPALVAALTAGVERAAELGYRGYCSLDAGVSRTGELRVIDPNFRISGASAAVVHRAALMAHHPCVLGAFWNLLPGDDIDVEARLGPLIDDGRLVVLMYYDPAGTANPAHPATVYGLIGAASREACAVLVAQVQRGLST